jgi:hypothetical protein
MRILILIFIFFVTLTSGFSQEKSKKEIKEEQKLEKQKQIDSLITSKEFVFTGTTALPQGMRSVNLAGRSNYVKFHADSIEGDLPYFGKAYSGGYGGDGGIQFDGKPIEYSFEKTKKNYQIKATIKGNNDTYKLYLSIGFGGMATLSVSSNNRSNISYNGNIKELKAQK